jgi:hypothetical protein
MRETIAHLKPSHYVYAITLAGFDGRPAGGGEGFDSAVSSLRDVIVSKHIIQPILVGHSMGGTLEKISEPERRSLADIDLHLDRLAAMDDSVGTEFRAFVILVRTVCRVTAPRGGASSADGAHRVTVYKSQLFLGV